MRWIERHRHLLDYTLSSLRRRKWRHLALLMVYTLIVFVPASAIFLGGALQYEAKALLSSAPDIVVQRIIAGRQVFVPQAYADRIQPIRGIQSVRLRLWGYYFNPINGSNYTIMVPPDFSHENDEIIVGEGVMRTWDPVEGRRLYFTTHDREGILLDAVETLTTDTGLVSSDIVLMSEPTFRRVSGLPPGYVADIVITVRNPREVPTIAGKIARALPDTLSIVKEDIQRTYQAIFDWRSGMVIVLFSGAVLAFFIFAWEKASGMSDEERFEIGILKSLGWGTADILAVKFWEGIVISLSAFLAGVVSAYIHVFLMSAPIFAHALKGWSVLYPRFDLPPQVNGGDIAVIFLLSVVPYTLMTVVPVWRTATLPPDTALRNG